MWCTFAPTHSKKFRFFKFFLMDKHFCVRFFRTPCTSPKVLLGSLPHLSKTYFSTNENLAYVKWYCYSTNGNFAVV